MKLQQLRYFREIVRQNLNVSKAAKVLCTSQSGISKQIQLLEDELGVALFVRKGRKLAEITDIGQQVLSYAEAVLDKILDIKQLTEQFRNNNGSMTVATTHTQARYILPSVLNQFSKDYPDISFNLLQSTPDIIARRVVSGEADIAIATEALEDNPALICLPCYQWTRSIIVPRSHPLAAKQELSLSDLVDYPIITYILGFTGRRMIDQAFSEAGLEPNIVLKAADADVIKTYVRMGFGIGILANMAFNKASDYDLVALDASHLFGVSTTYIAFKKDRFIRDYIIRFITSFSPHLNSDVIAEAIACHTNSDRKRFFEQFDIPIYAEPKA